MIKLSCIYGRNFVNWGPGANIHYGVQWHAVTSETGNALGMPKLVMQFGILWVVNG